MRDEYLLRARTLLEALRAEKIAMPGESSFSSAKLNLVRKATEAFASTFPAPGLTSCVAVSLLGVAACQELTQRFALEYFLKYKAQDVHLIFLGNPSGMGGDNHVFVLIGSATIPDELLIGRGNGDVCLASAKDYLSMEQFLRMQSDDCVIADPLLNFYDSSANSHAPLETYCKEHSTTHVLGVRSYQTMRLIIDNAAMVKENAIKVATQVNHDLNLAQLNLITNALFPVKMSWAFHAKQNCFFVKGNEENLNKLHTLFSESGFTTGARGEVDIVKGTVSGASILVVKKAAELDVGRLLSLLNSLLRATSLTKTPAPKPSR